jgi:hypothetical protein
MDFPPEIIRQIIEHLLLECECYRKVVMFVSKQWNELVKQIKMLKTENGQSKKKYVS